MKRSSLFSLVIGVGVILTSPLAQAGNNCDSYCSNNFDFASQDWTDCMSSCLKSTAAKAPSTNTQNKTTNQGKTGASL